MNRNGGLSLVGCVERKTKEGGKEVVGGKRKAEGMGFISKPKKSHEGGINKPKNVTKRPD